MDLKSEQKFIKICNKKYNIKTTTELILYSKNLTEIPEEIKYLKNLQVLYLITKLEIYLR